MGFSRGMIPVHGFEIVEVGVLDVEGEAECGDPVQNALQRVAVSPLMRLLGEAAT
jgi:hypothetical protein